MNAGGEPGAYEGLELALHGDAGCGGGFGIAVVSLAFGLVGGEHHEGAVAGEDVGDEFLMGVWKVLSELFG